MAIFDSYVSLPEGSDPIWWDENQIPWDHSFGLS